MADVLDVAAYILERHGPMTAMKLHKLLYYSQAWHLVWDEEPLFGARIEAWRQGPVIPDVYRCHRGAFNLSKAPLAGGNSEHLAQNEAETIEAILRDYGDWTAYELSRRSHNEPPWKEARGDLPRDASSDTEITHDAMYEYYQSAVR